MSTTVETRTAPSVTPTTSSKPAGPSVVFEDATWDEYEAMLHLVGKRPIRVTYDGEKMEIVSPVWRHGRVSYLLGRLIDILTEEREVAVEAVDPVTFKSPDTRQGIEPDKCYYLGDHAALVRGKERLIMGQDPPPDLVIEADVTHSSLDRLAIYAALGIREVWRFNNDTLEFLHLQSDKTYQVRDTSLHFPEVPRDMIAEFLNQAPTQDKTAWVRTFRAYVRSRQNP